jgi:hypothetical protein
MILIIDFLSYISIEPFDGMETEATTETRPRIPYISRPDPTAETRPRIPYISRLDPTTTLISRPDPTTMLISRPDPTTTLITSMTTSIVAESAYEVDRNERGSTKKRKVAMVDVVPATATPAAAAAQQLVVAVTASPQASAQSPGTARQLESNQELQTPLSSLRRNSLQTELAALEGGQPDEPEEAIEDLTPPSELGSDSELEEFMDTYD